MAINYTKHEWKDKTEKDAIPITYDRLNEMETGIKNAVDGVNDVDNALKSLVSPCNLNNRIRRINSGESWTATENCWVSIYVNASGSRNEKNASVSVDGVVIFNSRSCFYYSSEGIDLTLPPCYFVRKSQVIKVIKGDAYCDIYGCY